MGALSILGTGLASFFAAGGKRAAVLKGILLAGALLLFVALLFTAPCVFFSNTADEYSQCVADVLEPVSEFSLESIGE